MDADDWIDVKENLPSWGRLVLFWDRRYNEPEVRRITDDFEPESTYTHWMYLRPPKVTPPR